VKTGAAADGWAATDASREAPIGPATAPSCAPSETAPPSEKDRSAASVLSTTKKSATCAPSWKPNDAPTVPMADGADQPPRGRRATTRPVPNRAEKAKPAFVTRKKACAQSSSESFLEASGERQRRHVVELLSRRWRGGHA